MVDRDKVLKGLEGCSGFADCDKCPYDNADDCICELMTDALGLMKQEEEVPVKRCLAHQNARYPFSCGNCGSYLMPNWIACPMCGRKVKWE